MASSMLHFGIGVDVLCIANLHIKTNTAIHSKPFQRLLLGLCTNKKGIALKVVRRLFSSLLIKTLVKQYDLIDFHAFTVNYIPLMRHCVANQIPYDITLWGSDIMRADETTIREKKFGFDHCHRIKATENLQAVVSEKYPGLYEEKFKTVYWGNNDYEIIDRVWNAIPERAALKAAFIPEAGDRIIVTCGYNGSKGQNHIGILETIGRLSSEEKNSIFILLPMTYGATNEYLQIVEEAAKRAQVLFVIYSKRLSEEIVAKIRLVSDIVVNMQDTDAFSASLQDHLYCENVLLIGEWLNYIPLDKADVYYQKTSFSELGLKLSQIISNLPELRELVKDNHRKMMALTSWGKVLPQWADAYIS